MAIVNATPDSFSDGGLFLAPEAAVARGLELAQEGAIWIDVGGESTRPGSARVDAKEQIRRTAPVVRGLRRALDGAGLARVSISIDTTLSEVAAAALTEGASLVNDVSAGEEDACLLSLAARNGAGVCLMHKRGEPASMQRAPHYENVVAEVKAYLLERAKAAQESGIAKERILLDPGIGFGKTLEHNLALMRALPEFVATGFPILLGASRKRWISEVSGDASTDRLGGSIAASLWAMRSGAAVVRTHEVRPHLQAMAAFAAIAGG